MMVHWMWVLAGFTTGTAVGASWVNHIWMSKR
jgi:hypothetical protein